MLFIAWTGGGTMIAGWEWDRYINRLHQRIPTIPVLVGPVDQGWEWWKTRAEDRGCSAVRCDDPREENAVRFWIRAWLDRNSLLSTSARYAVREAGMQAADPWVFLRGKSEAERRLFLANHFEWRETAAAKVIGYVLEHLPRIESLVLRPEDLCRDLMDSPLSGCTWIEGLFDLETRHAPALLMCSAGVDAEEARQTADLLAKWIFMKPSLLLGWALPVDLYASYLQTTPESKAKALLRETVIDLFSHPTEQPSPTPILAAPPASVAPAPEGKTGLVRVPDFEEKYAETIREIREADVSKAEGVERARSAAEAFLYECLNSLPETAGLFELNRRVDLPGEGAPALEIDLLCERYRVAVEIDGYFHFGDREAYRRDRSRDYRLQLAGYFVLRFHAEDVVEQLEMIFERIGAVVAARRRSLDVENR